MKNFNTWQEFEEFVRDILENHNIKVEFRKVFSDGKRKYEIDIIGSSSRYVLCFDCKFYGKGRRRVNRLRQEARKHIEKVKQFNNIKKDNRIYIPVIVMFLDDSLLNEEGCLFVPYFKLNNFLKNIESYIEMLEIKTFK